MSYQVLARKYRPASFRSVSGQEHVTRTLKNAIEQKRIGHAYLFAGPRGVGKTSIARILSKSLNCEQGPTPDPCLECSNCREITQGTSIAVREIDGASHNSVENVRELIENFRSLPPPGSRYKIYIIDEVHMLSTAAFNALLKSLEEPPPNTVFILATTEPHKIPDTVISRCQRHDFRALGTAEIVQRLADVLEQEGLHAEPDALRLVARLAEGSMRDAQSLLERVRSYCTGSITAAEASQALGTVEQGILTKLSAAILSNDAEQSLRLVNESFSSGLDPSLFLKEFVAFWRSLLIAKVDTGSLLFDFGYSQEESRELRGLVQDVDAIDLQDLVSLTNEGADRALRSMYPRYAFEALIVKMATRTPVKDLGAILGKMRAALSGRAKGAAAGAPRTATRSIPKMATAEPPREEPRAASAAVEKKSDDVISMWSQFVAFCEGKASPILFEHLKRLAVSTFSPGELEAKAPKLAFDYLEEPENRQKLLVLLRAHLGTENWKLRIGSGLREGSTEPGSLLDRQQRQSEQRREQKRKQLSEHPRIQELRKAFPGSSIETIKTKSVQE